MVYAHLAPFDASRDFEAATFFRAYGVAFERGAPFPGKDESGDDRPRDERLLKRLYEQHKIGYADASEDESAKALLPASIEETGGGWYAVKVPWIDEPEKVQGRDKATLRATELRDAGEPDDHHGVAMLEGDNGWYKVNAAWLPEPESIHGQEAAYKRATELRAEGPPTGWEPPVELATSESMEATYEIGTQTVELVDLARAAQVASGHDVAVWNALDTETRDGLIKAELDRQVADAAPADAPADDEEETETRVNLEGGQFWVMRGGEPEEETEATNDQLIGAWKELHGSDEEQTLRINVEAGAIESLADGEWSRSRDATEGELAYERERNPAAPTKDERIAALVDSRTDKQLRELIGEIDKRRVAAEPPLEPLGMKGDHNKTDLARLIVEADGDLETGGDGGAA